jgi:peptidoglycan hydrolase FlgJ
MNEISSIIPAHIAAKPSADDHTAEALESIKLKKACAGFEAILIFQLLKTMRQSVSKDGYMKTSQGQEAYEMMFDQRIAEEIAHKGEGLGLQKMLYDQITRRDPKKD